jgi:dTDP-4-amino-4,6-dideoxygalactose transaminase
MINASLGANYSNFFVWESLKQLGLALVGFEQPTVLKTLEKKLNQYFPGQVNFVYKGRDAIELCLKELAITDKNHGVITQAFTCSAIEEGINRAGGTAVYADIGKDQLNLTVETLEQAKSNSTVQIKAVIVQHSLGHPAEIKKIEAWCKKNQINLIEDLAQSFGATAENNQLLGTTADAVILSFGRDKILDGVTGGAVIFKNSTHTTPKLNQPAKKIILKDLSYPIISWLIRKTYSIGLGKIIHWLAKKTHWFYSPITSPTKTLNSLPSYFAKLINLQLDNLETTHQHRQKISQFYFDELKNLNLEILTNQKTLTHGSLLRFALTINNWPELIENLAKQQIYLADRWYRQPVDCGQHQCSTTYQKNSCPNAELVASKIINLPTHQQISIGDAEQIVAIIKNHVK